MATPQMPIRRGLKLFGSQGNSAVKAELQQLHDLKVMEAKALTTTFLKRKRSGKNKARGCVDGRPQRAYIPQEDARTPTVSTEAVFMTAVIDTMKNRTVAVVDIPGAFMQADMVPGVYMCIEGAMVELLMEIDYDMYHPHGHGKRETSDICGVIKSPIWYLMSGTIILGNTVRKITGVGIYIKCI